MHAVGTIDLAAGIGQDWPRYASLRAVDLDRLRQFEGNHHDTDGAGVDRRLSLLQLQQVSATGQSAEMPVEDQQHPDATVVRECMLPASMVREAKRNGGPSLEMHASSLL